MSRRIEITLALPVALPLIDTLREQAAKVETNKTTTSSNEQARANVVEVRCLLALFDAKFLKTGLITIDEDAGSMVLRACSFLRFQFCRDTLSAIPDITIETSLDPKHYTGDEQKAVNCYLLLAAIQEVLLKNLAIRPSRSSTWLGALKDFAGRIGNLIRPQNQSSNDTRAFTSSVSATSRDVWQVVVLNDPVNLMSYVTVVLRNELSLPEEIAQRHMSEVHELKSSTVWVGPRQEAEARVRALQSWHLRAVLRAQND